MFFCKSGAKGIQVTCLSCLPGSNQRHGLLGCHSSRVQIHSPTQQLKCQVSTLQSEATWLLETHPGLRVTRSCLSKRKRLLQKNKAFHQVLDKNSMFLPVVLQNKSRFSPGLGNNPGFHFFPGLFDLRLGSCQSVEVQEVFVCHILSFLGRKKPQKPTSQGFQSVPCCLEAVKYLQAFKKHSFVTPGPFPCLVLLLFLSKGPALLPNRHPKGVF